MSGVIIISVRLHILPPKLKKPRYLILFAVLTIAFFWWRGHSPGGVDIWHAAGSRSPKKAAGNFNKSQFSINDPSSLWVVVNKGRVLSKDYVPANLAVPDMALRLTADSPEMHLRADAASAMSQLNQAALKAGLHLMLTSGYRSYDEQALIYDSSVASQGQVQTEEFSARAGHSEHQTGLAADIEPVSQTCELDQCFGDTAEGKWLAVNAHNFGFIIRYPLDKQNLTGYQYEPWHIRYVGKALADQIYRSDNTLEQFFGLLPATTYPINSYQLRPGS